MEETKTNKAGERTQDKRKFYKTAKAKIGCAHFKAGQYVSVKYDGKSGAGFWYLITGSENGPIERHVAYPEHHLTDFCL